MSAYKPSQQSTSRHLVEEASTAPWSRPVSRRTMLQGAAGLAGGLLLAGCGSVSPNSGSSPKSAGSGRSRGKVKLTMFVFLGGDLEVMPREFAKEYESSHPNVAIDIYAQSNSVGYPKMLAQKKTDPSNPLVNLGFFNAQTTEQGKNDGMWQKLDYSQLSNATDIRDQFKQPDQVGIGISADQLGLLYNKNRIKETLSSWSDLWDPRFRGQVTFFEWPWWVVFEAAKANGGGLNNMDPGWKVWEDHADQIRTMVTSNPQYLNVLSNGTAPLTSYFNGTGVQWIRSGAPLTYVPPKEGAVPVPVYLQTVAGSTQQQLEVAHDIINEMLSPKWCTRWATTTVSTPANVKSKLPPKLAGLPAFSAKTIDNFQTVDYGVVGKNNVAWQQRWDQDVESKI